MVKKFLSAGLCCVLLGGCLTTDPAAPAKKDEKKCQQKCDKKAKECPKKANKKCDKKAKECPKKADKKCDKKAKECPKKVNKEAEKTAPAKKAVKAVPAKKAKKTAPAKDSFKIEKCTITGKTEADKFVYAPGEKMVFIINFNAGKQEIPAGKYNLAILRDGDDGINKTEKYDLALLPAALAGGLVAYLFYNWHPAKVFMGDTGSLFLGGIVCGLAFALDVPLVLILVGLVYIVETLSVILQVGYFKMTHGKRLFKMSPIHHHFEMCGWKEEKICLVFTAITVLMCVIAWFSIVGIL